MAALIIFVLFVKSNCNVNLYVAAFEGVEVVFHMAAPNSSINNYKLHYSVNVEGTNHLV